MTQAEVYDKLYRIAGHILRENNPCQIQTEDGATSCVAHRAGDKSYALWGNEDNQNMLCCINCGFRPNDPRTTKSKGNWTPNGCSTQNLMCKTYVCGYLQRHNPDLAAALRMIEAAARSAVRPACEFFRSREELLAKL